ncbi:MAG: hypothetical protein AAF542_16890 [Pseudomonadota bacterium]
MSECQSLLQQFEALKISTPDFHHEEHVRVAFEMLNSYDFVEACSRYANTIQAMAQSAGAPEKYNTTITFAFMSLVAERKANSDHTDVDSFLANNPHLLDRSLLDGWYSKERLTSATARGQFLLPDMGGRTARPGS